MCGQAIFTAEARLTISTALEIIERERGNPKGLHERLILKPTYRKAYLEVLLREEQGFREGLEALFHLAPEPTEEEQEEPLDWLIPEDFWQALEEFRVRWKLPVAFKGEIGTTLYLRRCGIPVSGVFTVNLQQVRECLQALEPEVEGVINSLTKDPVAFQLTLRINFLKSQLRFYHLAERVGSRLHNLIPELQEFSLIEQPLATRFRTRLTELENELEAHLKQQLDRLPERAWHTRYEQLKGLLPCVSSELNRVHAEYARRLAPEYISRSVEQVYLRIFKGYSWQQIAAYFAQVKKENLGRAAVRKTTLQVLSLLGMHENPPD
ncbi:MAG: hypothetical protein KatS3mg018_2266 [Fimbriimonadales bacterium]|nr:MAG: hypothetical protein KatS3mg018_2266 [Fimbriimonadales bacterium]